MTTENKLSVEEVITLIELKGWVEGKVSRRIDRHDRQWHKKVKGGVVTIRMWDHSGVAEDVPISWDMVFRAGAATDYCVHLTVSIYDFDKFDSLIGQVAAAWSAFLKAELSGEYVMIDEGHGLVENWVRVRVVDKGQDERPLFPDTEPAKWLMVELPGGDRKKVSSWVEEKKDVDQKSKA